jgi:tetratricopeptide (TPR) repeat protein
MSVAFELILATQETRYIPYPLWFAVSTFRINRGKYREPFYLPPPFFLDSTMGGLRDIVRGLGFQRETDPHSILQRGTSFIIHGEYHDAMHCFEWLIEHQPHCSEAYYWKGWLLHKLGLYEEAIRHLDVALEIDPDSKKVLLQKGNSLAFLARFEEAIQYYDRALAIDPQFTEALSNKAICYRRLGDHQRANQCIDDLARARGKYYDHRIGGD